MLDVASVEIIRDDELSKTTDLYFVVEWEHSWNDKTGGYESARNYFRSRAVAEDFRARITTVS